MDELRVSQLNQIARNVLSTTFGPEIWVVGEISGFKRHFKSGHCYFDLVEKAEADQYIAKISCAFFSSSILKWQQELRRAGLDRMELNDGMEVRLKARVDMFVKEGRYQLIVAGVDPGYTLGAIARKRAQTLEELKNEGLLELNKQLAMPRLSLTIGLITSEGSAAYNDFISIISASGYAFKVNLYDAHMQGVATIPEVVRGIRSLQHNSDVIVITRGGGSKSDLFYFDDIKISRAIAGSAVPVITGIGHEIDLSVADMVAHSHRVTPTDTANFLVGLLDEVWQSLVDARRIIIEDTHLQVKAATDRLNMTASVFGQLVNSSLVRQQGFLSRVAADLRLAYAQQQARLNQNLLQQLNRLKLAAGQSLSRQHEGLGLKQQIIELLNPAELFKRGYSIALNAAGRPLRSVADVKPGEDLTTVLSDGRIISTVKEQNNG